MVDVNDMIAGRQRGRLFKEVLGAAAARTWPRQAVAENVFFGDDGELVGFKAVLETEQHQTGMFLG